MRFREL